MRPRWRAWCAQRSVGLSTLLFALISLPYALSNVGLEYDEALHQVGAAEILHRGSRAGSSDPATWIHVLGVPFKLMVVPYTGAVKDALLVVPYQLFGTDPVVGRLLAVALGAVGVYGIGRLTRNQLGPLIGALCALVLAVNPAYIDQVVFDNGPVAVWMFGLGLLALALDRALRRPSKTSAFLLGVTIGLLVWIKLNALWLLASLAIAIVVVLARRIVALVRTDRGRVLTLTAMSGLGALLALGPFLAYQRKNSWKSFALDYLPTEPLTQELLKGRLRALPDALLSDAEHRAIWDGHPQSVLSRVGLIPLWQQLFVAGVVATALVLAFVLRDRGNCANRRRIQWARIAGVATALFAIQMLTTRYVLQQHHLVLLIPEVVVLCIVAWAVAAPRHRAWRWLGIGSLALYLGLAGYWNAVSVRHLTDTGGRGYWSGAIDCTARYVELRDDRLFQVLDWGMRTGIAVLADDSPRLRETWVPELSDPEYSARLIPWAEDLARGGTYLISAKRSQLRPAPGDNLVEALRGAVEQGQAEFTAVGFSDELGHPAIAAVEVYPPGADPAAERRSITRAAAGSQGPCSKPVVITDVDALEQFRSGRHD